MKESEEEKFILAVKPCRHCGHVSMAHKYLPIHEDKVFCIDVSISVKGEYTECKCSEFAPKDNLEFLRWKHDKKQGKKR